MNRKKINFVLIALMMGASFAFAAKNPLKQSTRYYYHGGEWQTTAPSSALECVANPNKICSGEFSSKPTTNNDVSANPNVENEILGNYQ